VTIAAIIALVIFLALSVKRPAWSFGLILGMLPIYALRFSIFNIPTTALELMVGVFLLAVIITNFNSAAWKRIKDLGQINLWIGVFFLAGVISTIVSPEPMRALGQLKAFIIEPVLLFYAATVVFKTSNDLAVPLRFLFWSASLISLFGLIQYWTHLFLPLRFWGYGEEVKRITSVFEYPNALALYLAPLFVFFLALHAKGYNLSKKYWPLVGLFAMAATIILTYSRGAWLGVIAGIAVLVLRQTGVSLRRWGIIGIISLLILSPVLFTRFKTTFHDASSSERMELYRVGVNRILNQPLVGNGLYGFPDSLKKSDYSGEILNYPHNIFLNFWLEMGLLGVISFALLIFFALRQYRRQPTVLKFAAGLFLLVMITHGMVDAPYFKNDLSILFWVILSVFYIPEK
jgi:putative inorganic carbon (hco3(-)) transporter